MERFAAESLQAERDAHIRNALEAKRPWPDIVKDYGITLEALMKLDEDIRKGGT